MKKVCILLATYNGKPYIEQQLESIFAQSAWSECTLFVRDDGSTDGTLEVLKKYEAQNKLTLVAGENTGYAKNFFWLIAHAPRAEFYAFCDQDDIWNKQKIARALTVLEGASARGETPKSETGADVVNKGENEPLLYCSDYDYYFTDSGNTVRAPHHTLKPSFAAAMTLNIAAGFTCVINDALKERLSRIEAENGMYHDYCAYLVALAFGRVVYDDFSAALYRRHKNTETKTAKNARDFVVYMIKRYVWGTIKNDKLCTLNALKSAYQNEFMAEQQKLLSLFTACTFGACVKKCFYPRRYRDSVLSDLGIRLLMLCNRF